LDLEECVELLNILLYSRGTFDFVSRFFLDLVDQCLLAYDFDIHCDCVVWAREFERVWQEVEHYLKITDGVSKDILYEVQIVFAVDVSV
jgi:hypothetical protein